MDVGVSTGLTAGVLSCVCNGSMAVFRRLKHVKASGVHPILYGLYVQTGHAVAAMMMVPLFGVPLHLQWQGLLGGTIQSVSMLCALAAIDALGVALSEPLWCGAATAFSFCIGKAVFAEGARDWLLCLAGLGLVLCGMGGVASAGNAAAKDEDTTPLTGEDAREREKGGRLQQGMWFAIATGCLGGCMMVPMHYVEEKEKGLAFTVSLAAGGLLAQLLITTVFVATRSEASQWHVKDTLLAGIGQGVVFQMTDALTVVAMLSPIGLGVAQPLRESGLVVGILWGVFFFQEIQGKQIMYIGGAAVLIVIGIIMIVSASS